MSVEAVNHGRGAISGAALVATLSALTVLPEPARAKATRELGQQLVDVYGSEAVNVTLQCQNAFLERGEEETAAQMLQVLTAIWDIEDRVAA